MTQWKLKSKRKATGALLKRRAKKFKYQRMRDYHPTLIGETKTKRIRTRNNNSKIVAFTVDTANVKTADGIKKVKIKTVVENAANPQFVRRNIITKGAIIETDVGNARVTSKPGQVGLINAVLVEENK